MLMKLLFWLCRLFWGLLKYLYLVFKQMTCIICFQTLSTECYLGHLCHAIILDQRFVTILWLDVKIAMYLWSMEAYNLAQNRLLLLTSSTGSCLLTLIQSALLAVYANHNLMPINSSSCKVVSLIEIQQLALYMQFIYFVSCSIFFPSPGNNYRRGRSCWVTSPLLNSHHGFVWTRKLIWKPTLFFNWEKGWSLV